MGCSQAKPSPLPSAAPVPAPAIAPAQTTVADDNVLESPSKSDAGHNVSALNASIEIAVVDSPPPPPPPLPLSPIENSDAAQQRSPMQRRASSRLAAELSQTTRQDSNQPAPGLSLRFAPPSPPDSRPDSIVPSEIDTVSQLGSEEDETLRGRAPTPPPPPEQSIFVSWDGLDVSRSVFFVFQCGESFKQTRVIESSGEAVWDETVDFLCKTPDETVSITAYSHHKHGASVIGTLEYHTTEDNHNADMPYQTLPLVGSASEVVMKVTTRVVGAHYGSHCKVSLNLLSVAYRGKRPGTVCVRVTCGVDQVTSPPLKLLPIVVMATTGGSKTPRSSTGVLGDPCTASNEVAFFGSLAGSDTEYLGYQLSRGLGGCVLIPPPATPTSRDASVASSGSDKPSSVSANVKAICDDWLIAVPGDKVNGYKFTFVCDWNPENLRVEAWRCVPESDGRSVLKSCELDDTVDGSLITAGHPNMIESRCDDVIVTFTAQFNRVNPPPYTGQTFSKACDRKMMEPPALTPPVQALSGITHVTTVQVLSASSLELKPSKFSRTHDKTSGLFVSLSCGGQTCETRRVRVTDTPVWNESFEFYTTNPSPSRFEKDSSLVLSSSRAAIRSDTGLPPTPKRKSFAALLSSPTAATTPTVGSTFRFDAPKTVADFAADVLTSSSTLNTSRKAPNVLTIRVYDSYGGEAKSGASVVDVLAPYDYLGDAVINVTEAIAATEAMPITIKLNHVNRGTITLALATTTVDCCVPKSYCTRVTVLKTEGCLVHPQSQHHIECRVGSQSQPLRTAICRNVSAPVWNQSLEVLTSSPLEYITGTLIKDKSTPAGVFRVDEEHFPLLRPGVVQTVTVPMFSCENSLESKAEDADKPMGSVVLLVSSGPVDLPLATALHSSSHLCCRVDVVGVIGLSGSVQLGVGAGVWTRQAVAVNGCGVWNDVLNVDAPNDDRLKLSLRGDTMMTATYDVTLRNFGACALEWVSFSETVHVLMKVAVLDADASQKSLIEDALGVIEIAPLSVSTSGNVSASVACESTTFDFPPDTFSVKRSSFVWLWKSDTTKLATLCVYKPSSTISDRQLVGSGLIEIAELASEFKSQEIALVHPRYCPEQAELRALVLAEAARTCVGNVVVPGAEPLEIDARNLLSLKQFNSCVEALECGQILLKQASHKSDSSHLTATCCIRLIRKETVFAALLLRLLGTKYSEQGVSLDQLRDVLTSLQIVGSLAELGMELLKPNKAGMITLTRIVNWLVTEDIFLSPDAIGLRAFLDAQSETSMLFGIASSTTVLPSQLSQASSVDRNTAALHCECVPWYDLLMPKSTAAGKAPMDTTECLKQLFLSPTFAGFATSSAWCAGCDVTTIPPDLRCFNDYSCRLTDVAVSSDASVVVSPASCRMRWYPDPDMALKAINPTLTTQTLFRDSYEAFRKTFQSPEVLMCRFGSCDAHRWSAPIDGTLAEPIAVSSPKDADVIVQALHSDIPGITVWLVAFGNAVLDSVSIVARGLVRRGDDCGFISFGCDRVMMIIDKAVLSVDEDVRRWSSGGDELLLKAGDRIGVIVPRVSTPSANTPSSATARRKISVQPTPTAARKPPVTPQKSGPKRRHSAAVNVVLSSAKKPPSRHGSLSGGSGMITATLGEGVGDAPWLDDIKNPNDSNTDLLVGEDLTSPVLHLASNAHVADYILEPDDATVDAKLMSDDLDLFDTDGDHVPSSPSRHRSVTPDANEFDTDL